MSGPRANRPTSGNARPRSSNGRPQSGIPVPRKLSAPDGQRRNITSPADGQRRKLSSPTDGQRRNITSPADGQRRKLSSPADGQRRGEYLQSAPGSRIPVLASRGGQRSPRKTPDAELSPYTVLKPIGGLPSELSGIALPSPSPRRNERATSTPPISRDSPPGFGGRGEGGGGLKSRRTTDEGRLGVRWSDDVRGNASEAHELSIDGDDADLFGSMMRSADKSANKGNDNADLGWDSGELDLLGSMIRDVNAEDPGPTPARCVSPSKSGRQKLSLKARTRTPPPRPPDEDEYVSARTMAAISASSMRNIPIGGRHGFRRLRSFSPPLISSSQVESAGSVQHVPELHGIEAPTHTVFLSSGEVVELSSDLSDAVSVKYDPSLDLLYEPATNEYYELT